MKYILRSLIVFFAFALMAPVGLAAEEDGAAKPGNLDKLLELVRQGRFQESQEMRQREQRFRNNQRQRQGLLNQILAEEKRLEAAATRLEKQYEIQAEELIAKETRLKDVRGELNEMFGHMESAATDAVSQFETSVTRGQYGVEREKFLRDLSSKMADGQRLPTITEIERLWYELQRETVASGQVARYTAKVIGEDGEADQQPVVRVGLFNVVGEDGYMYPSTGDGYSEYARQPGSGAASTADDLFEADSGDAPVAFVVDPTGPSGGSLLAALISVPTLRDRIEQGGIVGYIIISLGIVGVILALWRLLALVGVGGRVKKQMKSDTPSDDNPLGRILGVYQTNSQLDPESVELKLAEAIIKERPKIEMGISFIRIIAAVAPLLGLLGTVTGMIITFQAIVLFGTGDPKTMAGGISTALITTVLGLCVAIPCLLLHSVVHARSRSILNVLEEQSAGLIAERAEGAHKGA